MENQNFHPGDLLPRFGVIFGTLAKWQFNRFNLTVPQSYTLMAVLEREIITMNELSSLYKVSQTTMTRMVDNLVRNGYVVRVRDEEDRRVVNVQLTKKGVEIAYLLKQTLGQLGDDIFSRIPADKRDQVAASLFLMLDAMEGLIMDR